MGDTYAVFQMAPASDGGMRRQGYVVYKGDWAGALDFLKKELSQNPTAQDRYELVKIVSYRADIDVSVNIQATP